MITRCQAQADYIIILICDNIPNQKFWNGNDWTNEINEAKLYTRYALALKDIFSIPENKVSHRITTCPKNTYLDYLKEQS